MPDGIKAHLVFHVSKLKRTLHPLENVVSPKILVELIKPPFAPHELERILGFRVSTSFGQVDRFERRSFCMGAYYHVTTKNILSLFSQTKSLLKGGSNVT